MDESHRISDLWTSHLLPGAAQLLPERHPCGPLACPEVHVTMPDLGVYDALLEGEGVVA